METPAQLPCGRRLRVDLADLAVAFDDASWEVDAYLDLDTGEVIRVTSEIRQELEAIYAEMPENLSDEEAYRSAFAAALEWRSPPPLDVRSTPGGRRGGGWPRHALHRGAGGGFA